MPHLTVNPLARNVHEFRMEFDSSTESQWFLLISDVHLDNPKCNRALLLKHLRKAQEREASVMIFGDLLCLMQGRNDRRGSKQALTPKQLTQPYFDAVSEDAYEFLKPFKNEIDLITYGNHETAIIRHNEMDPLKHLTLLLNQAEGSDVHLGGYGGWCYLKGQSSQTRSSLKMKYHHGSGGSSQVTKGAVSQQRAAATYDADIIVQGHIHQRQVTHHPREKINDAGRVMSYSQVHLRCPTYKDAWADGAFGWEIEKGMGPSPLGGWWLRVYWQDKRLKFEYQVAD